MGENDAQNNQINDTCIKEVGGVKCCPSCFKPVIKYGHSKSGKQRYRCSHCKKCCVSFYRNKAYIADINVWISRLLKEGCGIRSIARLLQLSVTTVLRRIRVIAASLLRPPLEPCKEYELDELCTFAGSKAAQLWIVYAIRRDTKVIADFTIGSRSNKVLSAVTGKLMQFSATRIYTDKLLQYKSLIPSTIHVTDKYGINHIERNNLTLRTHLKRLNRKTICFSKSIAMLHACLLIYFFG